MRNNVLKWCREQQLVQPGMHIVCAISGGADSVSLLHVLHSLQKELGITVSAAHFNHRLRGTESDRDETFVRSMCEALGVELYVGSGDVRARAAETGESIEEAARNMRYAFLDSLGQAVATGHTADDNLETVLLNFLRGTTLRGLCGIPPIRGRYLRPMLNVTREDVLAYLDENGLAHMEDSSNASQTYLRNRVRSAIVPLMRQENPSLSRNVLQECLLLRRDEAYLAQQAQKALDNAEESGRWSCERLRSHPEPVRTRAIRTMLQMIHAPKITHGHILAVDALLFSDDPSAEVHLPCGWTARRQYAYLTLAPAQATNWPQTRLNLNGVTHIAQLGLRITCRIEKNFVQTEKNENSTSTFAFKYDTIDTDGTVFVRSRQPQDSMRLSGGSRSLKKLFIDRKIPASERSRIPVIADAKGVIGVSGIGVNLDRKAKPGTCAVWITIEREETQNDQSL